MSKAQNKKFGHLGEDFATQYLLDKGFTLVKRNWGNKFGEIDIIAKDRETLVFVEVKTKTNDLFGLPEEMVGKGKLNKVRRMAQIYLDGQEVVSRVDVVAVMLTELGKLVWLKHYENVY